MRDNFIRANLKKHPRRLDPFGLVFGARIPLSEFVDLLVKLALDDEYRSYAPLVDANQFLTVAKQSYGLDPTD